MQRQDNYNRKMNEPCDPSCPAAIQFMAMAGVEQQSSNAIYVHSNNLAMQYVVQSNNLAMQYMYNPTIQQSHNLAMHYMCNPTIWQCNICAMLQSGNAFFWATICNRTQRNFITSSHHAFLISGCWPTITVGGASSWGWMHFFSYLWLTQLHRQTFLFISDQLQLLQAPKCLLSGIPMKSESYHFSIINLKCKESSCYRCIKRVFFLSLLFHKWIKR